VDWDVGDRVWVSIKSWKTARPSKKLDQQIAGPYRVLEKVRANAYRIELLASIKVYNVLNASKLRKVADDPLLGQIVDELPPIMVDSEQE